MRLTTFDFWRCLQKLKWYFLQSSAHLRTYSEEPSFSCSFPRSEQLEIGGEMNTENKSHKSVGQAASNQQTEHSNDLIAMDTQDQHQSEVTDAKEEMIQECKTQNTALCEGDSPLEAEPSQEENKEVDIVESDTIFHICRFRYFKYHIYILKKYVLCKDLKFLYVIPLL